MIYKWYSHLKVPLNHGYPVVFFCSTARFPSDGSGKSRWGRGASYPLENPPMLSVGKSTISTGPFSIAMLNKPEGKNWVEYWVILGLRKNWVEDFWLSWILIDSLSCLALNFRWFKTGYSWRLGGVKTGRQVEELLEDSVRVQWVTHHKSNALMIHMPWTSNCRVTCGKDNDDTVIQVIDLMIIYLFAYLSSDIFEIYWCGSYHSYLGKLRIEDQVAFVCNLSLLPSVHLEVMI